MPGLMKVIVAMMAVTGTACMGGLLMLVGQQWLLVKVDTKGPDEMHLVVPVPVGLLQAGAVFMPDEARRVDFGSEAIPVKMEDLRRLAAALEGAPDGVYVRVTSPRETVRIEKQGGDFNIFVKTAEEKVDVRIPIAFLTECLNGMDQNGMNTQAAVDALSTLRHKKVVDIEAPDADVTIWSW